MKTLIISDIHDRVYWIEDCIKNENPDFVIFLGDYFDSYNDEHSPNLCENTAKWLAQSIKNKNRFHMLGNHDLTYGFAHNSCIYCPGFTKKKKEIVDLFISEHDWNTKFYFCLDHENYIFSHAGFHVENFLSPMQDPNNVTKKDIYDFCQIGFEELRKGKYHSSLEQGVRMGFDSFGGCFWLDWWQFKPIRNINQIVGHSFRKNVENKNNEELNSYNYNLDCGNKYYGILLNGDLRFVRNKHF